jgi:hypothetical protein
MSAPKRNSQKSRMGRTEARMRKELADRGIRVSEAWSRGDLEDELARAAARESRRVGDVRRAVSERRGRQEKARMQ